MQPYVHFPTNLSHILLIHVSQRDSQLTPNVPVIHSEKKKKQMQKTNKKKLKTIKQHKTTKRGKTTKPKKPAKNPQKPTKNPPTNKQEKNPHHSCVPDK